MDSEGTRASHSLKIFDTKGTKNRKFQKKRESCLHPQTYPLFHAYASTWPIYGANGLATSDF